MKDYRITDKQIPKNSHHIVEGSVDILLYFTLIEVYHFISLKLMVSKKNVGKIPYRQKQKQWTKYKRPNREDSFFTGAITGRKG